MEEKTIERLGTSKHHDSNHMFSARKIFQKFASTTFLWRSATTETLKVQQRNRLRRGGVVYGSHVWVSENEENAFKSEGKGAICDFPSDNEGNNVPSGRD